MKIILHSLILFAIFFIPYLVVAEESVNNPCQTIIANDGYASYVFTLKEDDKNKLDNYCQLFYGIKNKEQDNINKALAPIIERSNGLSFLKDIDFKAKTFEVVDGGKGLGFSYNYNKTNELTEYQYDIEDNVTTGLAWVFAAKGNVALDKDINPSDFLDTRVSVSGFRDYGGVSNTKVVTQAIQQKLYELDNTAVDLEGEALMKNRKEVKTIISNFFSTQIYFDFDVNAGLESNQRFTEKQWTYGTKLALDIKGYGSSSKLGAFNLIDYPFALLRIFTGYTKSNSFTPLGASFPTFAFRLDQIDPIDNTPRESVGEDGKFSRVSTEIYFRTPVGRVRGNEVFANIDFRYWKELDASNKIKAADIDAFSYTTLSLSSDTGVFVSYSEGKLPFDLENKKVYELGWKFNFN